MPCFQDTLRLFQRLYEAFLCLTDCCIFCVVHEYHLWVLLGISKAESEEDFATKFKYDVL